MLPYWHDNIVPAIKAGQRVLIAAHGNTIRAIVKYFDNVSDKDIVELNIPTGTNLFFVVVVVGRRKFIAYAGIPLVYELDEELRPVKHYYLADEETVKAAVAAVQHQVRLLCGFFFFLCIQLSYN